MAMKQSIDPDNAARAVFRMLENHVSAGEIRDVMQILPEDIRALPPLEEARLSDRVGGVFRYSMIWGSSPLARIIANVLRDVPQSGL